MESAFLKALLVAKKNSKDKEKQSEDRAKNLLKRVDDDQVKQILGLEAKQIKRAEIAKQTGISAHTIYNVVRRYSIDENNNVVLNDRDHISQ